MSLICFFIVEQSTAALSTLSESYSNLDTLLSSSRSLVSSLLHSQKSDTWYLESAFWILVTTISWLVFRRLLYGPSWWLLYLPTRLLWNSTFALAHALVGASAAIIGTLHSASQSRAVSEPSASLIIKPSATGGIPKFSIEMSAPSINVGGGGSGAKDMQHKAAKPEGKSVTEDIDKMAEVNREEAQGREASRESSQGGTILRERNSDEPPNPKKRMWEEGSNSPHQGDQPRDEL